MADISQVLTTLQDIITPLIYPNGILSPSITGQDIDIMPGWPTKNDLDAWLLSGKSVINIFPTMVERNTTRYLKPWQLLSLKPVTITATVVFNVITFGGTRTAGEVIMTICNGIAYSYTELVTDTLNTIAANIATLIPNAIATNNTITISNCTSLIVRVGDGAVMGREVKRQLREILIRVWTSAKTASAILDRSTISSVIDSHLSDIERFVLPDNTWARIYYSSSKEQDALEIDDCYVRDLNYYVEYPTMITAPAYSILDAEVIETLQ
jgi:hypothetical protein